MINNMDDRASTTIPVRAALADREKNLQNLVNDVCNDDRGSKGGSGSSRSSGHIGYNFGVTGCLTILYMLSATISFPFFMKPIFTKN